MTEEAVVDFRGGGRRFADNPAAPEPECPIMPLGQLNGHYWFLSPSGELRMLEARQLAQILQQLRHRDDRRLVEDDLDALAGVGEVLAAQIEFVESKVGLMEEVGKVGVLEREFVFRVSFP